MLIIGSRCQSASPDLTTERSSGSGGGFYVSSGSDFTACASCAIDSNRLLHSSISGSFLSGFQRHGRKTNDMRETE